MKCRAFLKGNTLVLENDLVRRTFLWNRGHLIGRALCDKKARREWALAADTPDCFFPGNTDITRDGRFHAEAVPASGIRPAHLCATVTSYLGGLAVRRTFRLFPGVPAIACGMAVRGRAAAAWTPQSLIDRSIPLENVKALLAHKVPVPVLDRLSFAAADHLRIKSVRFYDVTDQHNTLAAEQPVLPYTMPDYLKGNLLLCCPVFSDTGFFILKEAPCSGFQLHDPGYDFILGRRDVLVVGPGAGPEDLDGRAWTACYGCVVGVSANGEVGLLTALRAYQETLRTYVPARDDMIMLNTWGDRGQDTRISETFARSEIRAGARLGVTHFQLDDGWQAGRTINSATAGGSLSDIWHTAGFWDAHPERFPGGLAPVVKAGRDAGVELCVWFNPSTDGSYANWEKDADRLIALYRQHGIRVFKIDGVEIPDKRAETNLRAFFDKVQAATRGQAVFNLDVTAGRRFGYHYFTEYGNRFLENRYTDWSNYYPHWTLRNLWMLSRYVPPQALQIEFLNKWRNAAKYGDGDPLAPARIPFDYCFAVTLMAQPLAWFEASNLPPEAFDLARAIKVYRKHQRAIHKGRIFPIGEEPSGASWTGFQSSQGKKGYFLVFRERNKRKKAMLKLWQPAGRRVACRSVLGKGRDFTGNIDAEGRLGFTLPEPMSFALYAYRILK
jgi:hypothetical protein